MRSKIPRFIALSFMACLSFAAAQAAPQAPNEQAQEFTVLRTGHLVAGTQALTNAEANCSIAGSGGDATMQCRPSNATAKALYNYNTALVVETNGVAYIIACRIPLIAVSCKKLDTGSVVEVRVDKGLVAIADGDKVRRYQIFTSGNVGPLPLGQPPPSKGPAQARSEPRPVATAAPPSNNLADSQEADSAAIKKLFTDFNDAFNKHDAHAAAMLFTADADFINVQAATTHGRAEIEQHLAPLFAARLKTAHRDVSLRDIRFLRPDTATVDSDFRMSGLMDPNGGPVLPANGLYDWIVMKQNGRWLIAVWHESNLPAPPPPPR
jgi:uncharacterized protein (TIGR02246 family)